MITIGSYAKICEVKKVIPYNQSEFIWYLDHPTFVNIYPDDKKSCCIFF